MCNAIDKTLTGVICVSCCNHIINSVKPRLRRHLCSSVKLAQEKGASNWLSCLPLKSHTFVLHKAAFHDAIALHYHWLPSACLLPVPVVTLLPYIEHALSCPKGGFPSLRHNEVCDLTANLLSVSVTMLSLNPTFSLFLVRPFNTKQLTVMITQGLTLQLMVVGEDNLRGHTLMSEFLTLVHPQINPYILHTDVMNTNNGFMK